METSEFSIDTFMSSLNNALFLPSWPILSPCTLFPFIPFFSVWDSHFNYGSPVTFYPPYWLASYPGLKFPSFFLLSSQCHQQIWKAYSDTMRQTGRTGYRSRRAEEREYVGNQRKRECLEREIGNAARNTQPSAAVPAVRQNRDAKQRWIGLPGGSSTRRIWGGNGTWSGCQGWIRGQYFSSVMFGHEQLKQGCILDVRGQEHGLWRIQSPTPLSTV